MSLRLQTMTRYFLDIAGNAGRFSVGGELPDDSTAWREALSQVRSVEDSLSPGGTLRLFVSHDDRKVFEP